MRLLTLIFVGILLSPNSVFALDFIKCKEGVASISKKFYLDSSTHIELNSPSQLYLKGRLDDSFDLGLARKTWSVIDESREKKVFSSAIHSIFPLNNGDEIIVINEINVILFRGYFGTQNNLPVLFKDKILTEVALGSENFTNLFMGKATVAVVHTMDSFEQVRFQSNLVHQVEAHREFQNNPARFIRIGNGNPIELAHYQTSIVGRFQATVNYEKMMGGRFQFVSVQIKTDGALHHLKMGDYIYFVSGSGQILGQGRVDNQFGIERLENARNPLEVKTIADKSSTIVVIRSK
jgi:hypothetical protein